MRLVAAAGVVAACCISFAASAVGAVSAAPAGAPSVEARAWLLEDPLTGAVLASHNPDAEMPIASITKLMTLIVALGHLRLDQSVEVDPRAAAVGQESVYLTADEQISVHDLVEAALIQSANDAADALALAVAPSFRAFAVLMNAKARELGLTETHFVRPDGLDAPGEYSSVRDVTRLALAAMKIPVIAATVDRATATISGDRVLHTWNDLLGVFPGVFGVKTGHTSAAGWCQVVAVHGQGTTLYAAILGSPSRAQRDADLERLLLYGLAQYRRVDLVSTGRQYAQVALPYGRGRLALVATAPLELAARRGSLYSERVEAPLAVKLPVRAGAVLGRVEVFAAGRLVGERSLVAARAVKAPGLAAKLGWYARRTIDHIVGLLT
jgi:D-alanyl-D-alanine carboxypeptidase (penicillin-binding protein 5/6)